MELSVLRPINRVFAVSFWLFKLRDPFILRVYSPICKHNAPPFVRITKDDHIKDKESQTKVLKMITSDEINICIGERKHERLETLLIVQSLEFKESYTPTYTN